MSVFFCTITSITSLLVTILMFLVLYLGNQVQGSLVGFDFSQYTYILSYGFSIEYLYCKQPDAKKMQYGKVVHDVNCLPNEVLLYRVPRVYIEPNPDRTDSFSYKFIHYAP